MSNTTAPGSYHCEPKDLQVEVTSPGLLSILDISAVEASIIDRLLKYSQSLKEWSCINGKTLVGLLTVDNKSMTADMACACIHGLKTKGLIKSHWTTVSPGPEAKAALTYYLTEPCVETLFAYALNMGLA